MRVPDVNDEDPVANSRSANADSRLTTTPTRTASWVLRVGVEVALITLLDGFLAADDKTKAAMSISVQGLQPAYFETTAWDLALATQALVYMDRESAFAVSRVYALQQRYESLTQGITNAMYLRPAADPTTFFPAVHVYFSDLALPDVSGPKVMQAQSFHYGLTVGALDVDGKRRLNSLPAHPAEARAMLLMLDECPHERSCSRCIRPARHDARADSLR